MRPVTKEQFFAKIGPLDVHPRIVTAWPFTALWETPGRQVRGKSVIRLPGGNHVTDYYLPE